MMKKRKAVFAVLVTTFAAIVAIFWGSQKFLKVTKKTIYVTGLPKALDGLKILQISDLHSNDSEKVNVNIWKAIDSLSFDIAVITGDLIDKNPLQITPHLDYIKNLASNVPVFMVEGNHDHRNMARLRPYLEEAGVTVLVDEISSYEFNGATFDIVGLSDYYTADFAVSSKLFEKPSDFRLALLHQPQHADCIEVDATKTLFLAGHTHGGQLRAPFFPTIYAPGQGFFPKYGYGTYAIGDNALFVSKGIGSTGNMPFRLWNRPEICVLTLAER